MGKSPCLRHHLTHFCMFVCYTGSHFVAQAGVKHIIGLPPHLEYPTLRTEAPCTLLLPAFYQSSQSHSSFFYEAISTTDNSLKADSPWNN